MSAKKSFNVVDLLTLTETIIEGVGAVAEATGTSTSAIHAMTTRQNTHGNMSVHRERYLIKGISDSWFAMLASSCKVNRPIEIKDTLTGEVEVFPTFNEFRRANHVISITTLRANLRRGVNGLMRKRYSARYIHPVWELNGSKFLKEKTKEFIKGVHNTQYIASSMAWR